MNKILHPVFFLTQESMETTLVANEAFPFIDFEKV